MNKINEGLSLNSAAIGSAPKFSPRAAKALKLAVNKKESSNFNGSAENSDRINEEYNLMFGQDMFGVIPNEDPISSSVNNVIAERKMFVTTESCVSRYTSLFNILETRSNPLLSNKGRIQ